MTTPRCTRNAVFRAPPSQTTEEQARSSHLSPVVSTNAAGIMGLPSLLTALMAVAMAMGAQAVSKENNVDHGYWNYREGADSVNVASVRSVTRVLDVWGKRIFKEIKTLLYSQPNTLLPDYSRVRPLSESINDLFREVSLLHRRITELSHRLATLEPILRRLGYQGEDGEETAGSRAQSLKGEATTLARFDLRSKVRASPPRGSRVVRRRRLRVFRNRGGKLIQDDEKRTGK